MYLTLPDAADEPGKRLVGFDRIDLAAGEKRTVEVIVDSTASNQPVQRLGRDGGCLDDR